MFRHLDDPASPAADGAQLRSVLRRSDRLRFQRRRRWATTAVAVALCSALVAIGLLSVRTAGPQMAGKETAYQFNQAVHLHIGTPVPTTARPRYFQDGIRRGLRSEKTSQVASSKCGMRREEMQIIFEAAAENHPEA